MHFTAFDNSEHLAEWLANLVAEILSTAIGANGKASLAVSGGSTPKAFFEQLSKQDIAWSHVWVTLVDERWVAPTSNRSNQRMVTLDLLQDKAAAAHFVPLFRDGMTYEEIGEIEPELSELMPFDATILGMGMDGHTASLFHGGDNLDLAIDEKCSEMIMGMNGPKLNEPRVTLTLPALVSSRELVLHIEGTDKRRVLEAADETIEQSHFPISSILQNYSELRVVWAP